MHVKGRGGVKGAIRWIDQRVSGFKFAARFDIAFYYQSISHSIILGLLEKIGIETELQEVFRQVPDLANSCQGIIAGGSI